MSFDYLVVSCDRFDHLDELINQLPRAFPDGKVSKIVAAPLRFGETGRETSSTGPAAMLWHTSH
jgi:hypothetical protein